MRLEHILYPFSDSHSSEYLFYERFQNLLYMRKRASIILAIYCMKVTVFVVNIIGMMKRE